MRPEPGVGRWLRESSEVGQEWPSDPLSPAELGRLRSEARGWGWLIYEPSPHPAPPVSLVFLAISSSSSVLKASPPPLLSEDLAIPDCWGADSSPGGARVRRAWVKPWVACTLAPPPGARPEEAVGGGLGRRRGGRAGRTTPETAGLPGGSLTFKVTRRGETTGPRQSRGHRPSQNPPGGGGGRCAAPQGSSQDAIEDVTRRPPPVPVLFSLNGARRVTRRGGRGG